jgi:hypothetical protein
VELARAAIAETPAGQAMVRIKPRPPRPADRDAAELAVEGAFDTVFGPDADFAARCAAIEGGDNLAATMSEVSDRFTSRHGLDVSVEHVRFLGDVEAEVSFVLLFPGVVGPSTMGPMGVRPGRLAEVGYAVLDDGVWKVARETYCGLVQRLGIQCPPPPG